jgi:SAM-dependent methyltransferase
MKLAEIPGGFALYKEKTAVGRCEVTATAQGAALTLLTIVPEWRRKGYGSYLLKEVLRRFGGYDKETATVFTAPLPGDEGERAFWEKFGFRAEGAQLCRRRTPDLTAVKFVQDFLTSRLAEPKLLVDATCGNGGDTAFLCRLAGKGGRVLGFDIQPEAIASTERNLAAKGLSAELHCDSHANLLQYVTPGTADAVMFNFGWLPGADHNVFSHASSSIPALEAALDALRPGGVLSAILYSGRVIGSDEKTEILNWMRTLPLSRCTVLVCGFANWAETAPLPCFVLKK